MVCARTQRVVQVARRAKGGAAIDDDSRGGPAGDDAGGLDQV